MTSAHERAERMTSGEIASAEHASHNTAHATEHAHPSPLEYVKIAGILAVITIVEVAIYYVKDDLGHAFAPLLILLSATKFSLVVLWFMHLKFDSQLFSTLFFGGLTLAGTVFIVTLATLGILLW